MNPNQYQKALSNVLPSQLFQEIYIKSKTIVSLPLLLQENGVI